MNASHPFRTLRQFVRPQARVERCEVCGARLGGVHPHLLEVAHRRLVCSCDACAILFCGAQSARYRSVPRRIEFLRDFVMTESQWEDLHIPINLAFFFQSTPAGRVIATYPSPAGATESLLTLSAWQALEAENPVLRELEADVEALLVNRVTPRCEHYRVPIDECFRLVGIIRSHWKGLSGGTDVWHEIERFFAGMKTRTDTVQGQADA